MMRCPDCGRFAKSFLAMGPLAAYVEYRCRNHDTVRRFLKDGFRLDMADPEEA